MVDPRLAGVCGDVGNRRELAGKDFVLGRGRGFRYVFRFANVLRNRPFSGAAGQIVGAVREINLWRW